MADHFYELYEVLPNMKRRLVAGKHQFGDLAHAKRAAEKRRKEKVTWKHMMTDSGWVTEFRGHVAGKLKFEIKKVSKKARESTAKRYAERMIEDYGKGNAQDWAATYASRYTRGTQSYNFWMDVIKEIKKSKKRKNPCGRKRRIKNGEIESYELSLYADNLGPSSQGHWQQKVYKMRQKFGRRLKAGANKNELSQIAGRAAQFAAYGYQSEFGSGVVADWRDIFSMQDVRDTRKYLIDSWTEEYSYKGNPGHKKKAKRKRNPKRKHWQIFAYNRSGEIRWVIDNKHPVVTLGLVKTRASGNKYKTQKAAVNVVEGPGPLRLYEGWKFGVAPNTVPVTKIRAMVGKGKRRRNPVGPTQREVDSAANLFKDFTGDHPERMKNVRLPVPKTGLVVGELDGVLYTTTRDGKREAYIHEFKKGSRPTLVSSHDGESLHILGGEYEFTERGIEDR